MMKLGSLFSDGVVLQRNRPISVWGETLPDVLVKAEITGLVGYAKSSSSGDFLLQMPPLNAGGPFELTVSVPDVPGEAVVLHDVYVGEVWLCSGQSNMHYCLGSNWNANAFGDGEEPLRWKQEQEYLRQITEPVKIHFYTVPTKVTGCREKYIEGSWLPMTAENAPNASAIGAWFGLKLHNELKVPVGLICCSWGGSMVETWTSSAALRSNPDTRPSLEYWEKLRREKATWTDETESLVAQIKKIARPDRGNQGFGEGWADSGLDDSQWHEMQVPGSWIAQGIAGDGAVWVRRKVTIPAELAGKELVLHLGGIDKQDITYFNGVEIGRTGKDLEDVFWNQPRSYAIPGNLVKEGENTIAIRAFSFAFDGGFVGLDKFYVLSGEGKEIPLCGVWKAKSEYDLGHIILPPLYGINKHNTPGLLFDSMIRPLLSFAFQGVIWYQGETNANNLQNARTYKQKLETMIRDWRFHFDQPELPFIQVQLADFRSPRSYDAFSAWAVLRHAQGMVCHTLPQVFMVTALDTGEEDDIHPQNKKEVGNRLAASALHNIYGQNVLPCGPKYVKAVPEDGALRV
ncbi:MAG: hypothetical protein IJS08_07440, partial [Victivallales bacterium]|nr:hypothetical protein [Victivallales bacterium]